MTTFAQFLKIALAGNDFPEADIIPKLDRIGAFAGKPAVRFILTTAIKNGTLSLFASHGGHSPATDAIVERFIAHTGIRPRLARGVFDSYAEALGWERRAVPPSEEADGEKVDAASPTDIRITVNREKEPHRGITVKDAAAAPIAPHTIRITATLHRTSPLGSAMLGYALRNRDGVLTATGTVATATALSPSVFPVSTIVHTSPDAPAEIELFIH